MFILNLTEPTPCTKISIAEADKLFFTDDHKSRIEKAKSLCATCPAIADCLQFALDEGIEYGIFGGTTPNERKAML